MFCGGVQICEGGSKSAKGGPNPQGVQIRCDTGTNTTYPYDLVTSHKKNEKKKKKHDKT